MVQFQSRCHIKRRVNCVDARAKASISMTRTNIKVCVCTMQLIESTLTHYSFIFRHHFLGRFWAIWPTEWNLTVFNNPGKNCPEKIVLSLRSMGHMAQNCQKKAKNKNEQPLLLFSESDKIHKYSSI